MMLQHLGHSDAHDAIITVIEDVIRDRDSLTADMGGKASCIECGNAIASALSA